MKILTFLNRKLKQKCICRKSKVAQLSCKSPYKERKENLTTLTTFRPSSWKYRLDESQSVKLVLLKRATKLMTDINRKKEERKNFWRYSLQVKCNLIDGESKSKRTPYRYTNSKKEWDSKNNRLQWVPGWQGKLKIIPPTCKGHSAQGPSKHTVYFGRWLT